jgi:hypothetical protein
MKKIVIIGFLFAIIYGVSSCSPYIGAIYTSNTLPFDAESGTEASKVGRAVCKSILGLIATGDCSIEAAKKAGGITTVSSVDAEISTVLFFFAEHTTVVRGE